MSRSPTSAVALISGRGSNLGSLLKNANDYQIVAIISDRADAAGLAYGKEYNVPTMSYPRAGFESLKAQKQAIYQAIENLKPELILLAGFMQIVAPEFVGRMFGKIVNIHPSLLPALPGLHTHERALQSQSKTHGCTVHFVDSGVDTGPIIAQAECIVTPDDTAETLRARVLTLEHALYPWVINQIGKSNIALDGKVVTYTDDARTTARACGFLLPNS